MPRCIAFFSAGTSASGSLAEMAMASTCWAISELMTSIWPFGGGVGRAGVDDLDVAQLLGRLLGALVGGLEEADAERLDDERDAHVVLRHGGAGAACRLAARPSAGWRACLSEMLMSFPP